MKRAVPLSLSLSLSLVEFKSLLWRDNYTKHELQDNLRLFWFTSLSWMPYIILPGLEEKTESRWLVASLTILYHQPPLMDSSWHNYLHYLTGTVSGACRVSWQFQKQWRLLTLKLSIYESIWERTFSTNFLSIKAFFNQARPNLETMFICQGYKEGQPCLYHALNPTQTIWKFNGNDIIFYHIITILLG